MENGASTRLILSSGGDAEREEGGKRWADTCSSGVRWVVRRGTVTGACCTVWVGLGVVIMKVINVLTRVIYEIDEIDECKSL
jgi:hypothetical protein